jgi:hypothetical protein
MASPTTTPGTDHEPGRASPRLGTRTGVVRLDELTTDQRRLVVALIEAAKAVDAADEGKAQPLRTVEAAA